MSELEELKLSYAECSRQRNELLNKLKSQAQRQPLTHEQAKALVAKYGNDPLNLVFQTEAAHNIKEIK